MPKISRHEWNEAGNPESEEYSPSYQDLEEEEKIERDFKNRLFDIQDMVEASERNYMYDDSPYIPNPEEVWDKLAWLKEDYKDKILDNEAKEKIEKSIAHLEKRVYKLYIPFVESQVFLYGYHHSPLSQYRSETLAPHSQEMQRHFEDTTTIINNENISEEEKEILLADLNRLENKYNQYKKEPSLFTFDELGDKLVKKIVRREEMRMFREESSAIKVGGNDETNNVELEELEKWSEEVKILEQIASNMWDTEIKKSCEKEVRSWYSYIEYAKDELLSPPELLNLRGRINDILERIKQNIEISEEEVQLVREDVQKLKQRKLSGDNLVSVNKLEDLFTKLEKAMAGEAYDEDEERFEFDSYSIEGAYSILGIESTATKEEIKKAFGKLAIKYHPDKNSDEDAPEKMRKILEAYELISRVKGLDKKYNIDK